MSPLLQFLQVGGFKFLVIEGAAVHVFLLVKHTAAPPIDCKVPESTWTLGSGLQGYPRNVSNKTVDVEFGQ